MQYNNKNLSNMKKLLLSITLLACAMFCVAQSPCWDGTVANAYNGGDGSMENPYQIATAEQLALLAQQTNDGTGGDACYILTDDICLNENAGPEGFNWTPIGMLITNDEYHAFTGIFDGGGHTIDNLYCQDNENWECTGLFGVAEGAVIKNIVMTNSLITDGQISGIIMGKAINTDVLNCTVYGEVHASHKLGGIIGTCIANVENDTVSISNCFNNAFLEDAAHIGGIVGTVSLDGRGSALLENCTNHSDLASDHWCGGIAATVYGKVVFKQCDNYGKIEGEQDCGGIVGKSGGHYTLYSCFVESCVNHEGADITAPTAGGIVGRAHHSIITKSVNKALITGRIVGDTVFGAAFVGGITGTGGIVSNSYNRGDLTAIKIGTCDFDELYIGGITGVDESNSTATGSNVYNTGNIYPPVHPSIQEYGYGNIVGYTYHPDISYYNGYWLDINEYPACGNEEMLEHPDLPGSTAFMAGTTHTSWVLDEAQYGTTDLLEALNAGALGQCTWLEDVTGINDGFPIIDMAGEPNYELVGSEWFYEINDGHGNIAYQHLSHDGDSTINDKKVKIIVKTNTLYDLMKDERSTHEYIYEENNIVYWWNKTTREFTVLYDFGANIGDEWTITAGENSVTVHVDSIGYYAKNARWFKVLEVSDADNVFTGTIACSVGHLTSFFPERLLKNNKDLSVDGIRCYWNDNILLLKEGDVDCDYIYNNYHDVEEVATPTFSIYPNPAKDVVIIETHGRESLQDVVVYDVTGRKVVSTFESQIDVSHLANGIYLLKIGDYSEKIVISK